MTRCAPVVAWALLTLSALGVGSVAPGGCLPPDFELVHRKNSPVMIDKSLLQISPDLFQPLDFPVCGPLVFDLSDAIVDADADDPVTIAWIVDFAPGAQVEPDAINRLRFSFDKCTNPKAESGVTTVEVLVFDRPVPLDVLADVDQLKSYADDDVTSDSVIWFVGFTSKDDGCCK